MSRKQNCWEFKKCGREENGEKVHDMGVCPAAADTGCDGLNEGENGGRICWAIAGTFCGGAVQGSFAEKQLSCMTCDFFKRVEEEEGVGRFRIIKPEQAGTRK